MPRNLVTSLDIRKPVISSDQNLARIHSDMSAVVHNVAGDSLDGDGQECAGQHLKKDRDTSQFASSPVCLCSKYPTDEGNEGKGGYM